MLLYHACTCTSVTWRGLCSSQLLFGGICGVDEAGEGMHAWVTGCTTRKHAAPWKQRHGSHCMSHPQATHTHALCRHACMERLCPAAHPRMLPLTLAMRPPQVCVGVGSCRCLLLRHRKAHILLDCSLPLHAWLCARGAGGSTSSGGSHAALQDVLPFFQVRACATHTPAGCPSKLLHVRCVSSAHGW
jgi:hypothetical protein